MPSPFPGMDPYLEAPAFWEGFHNAFMTEVMYHLSRVLPEGYVANIGERVHVISIADEAIEHYLPDAVVTRERARFDRTSAVPQLASSGATATLEPVTIPSIDAIEAREAYIEVVRLPDDELVTSIELLSPSNKFGEGVGEYRTKRSSLVRQGIHVVEIDLLRRGRRTELARPLPPGDYYAFVFRGDRRPDVEVYAWSLRAKLPTVRVPLRKPDADVPLDLAAVVTTIYDNGNYARKLRYGNPPPGPLSAEAERWATDLARTSVARR